MKTRGAELEDQSGTKRKEINGVAQMKRIPLTPDGQKQRVYVAACVLEEKILILILV